MQVEVRIAVLDFEGVPIAGSTRGDVIQTVQSRVRNIDRLEITVDALVDLARESVRDQLQTARDLSDEQAG